MQGQGGKGIYRFFFLLDRGRRQRERHMYINSTGGKGREIGYK